MLISISHPTQKQGKQSWEHKHCEFCPPHAWNYAQRDESNLNQRWKIRAKNYQGINVKNPRNYKKY